MSALPDDPGRAGVVEDLPRLAVVYDERSVDVFRFAAAGAGTWRTVWLLDEAYPVSDTARRLLRRFGPVVDIADLDPAQAALAIGAVDGLVVLNEQRLARGALLAPHLGVEFHSPQTVENLTDKAAQRIALHAAGLPTPDSVRLPAGTSGPTAAGLAAGLAHPVVVKPVRGRSSRMTSEIGSPGDLADFVVELGGVTPEDFVVEERIPDAWAPHERPFGDYVSVETFLTAGRFVHYSVTGRLPLASGFRETGNVMPSHLPREEWPPLLAVAEAAIEALGARTGVFHTEIKLSPVGPRVIEVNGRLGGGSMTWLAERVSERNLLGAVGRVALGLPVDLDEAPFTGVGFLYLEAPPEGERRVASIDGLDELRRLPGVEEVEVLKPVGAQVDVREGTVGAVYTVRGWAASHAALWALLESIHDVARVGYGG